ncbi:MAG: 30S ribosomal protein S1 [Myxococcota bacterium]|nr:30S ribosomal protein S1 [Myxococcota bacterium]
MTTPTAIDPNLNDNLADVDRSEFEDFFNTFLEEGSVKERSVVQGTVLSVSSDWVTVDVGYKAEGTISANQFRDADGTLSVAEGDKVDVYLDSMHEDTGNLMLSKQKADLMKAWDEISRAVEADETVTGTVVARVKGGLSVDIGVKAFLPGSQVDLRPVKNLDYLVGQAFDFKIIKFNKRRGNIVLSRRVLLEKEREVKRSSTVQGLREGVIMQGQIKNITDYGAFVDLGGIDGLLHITDMSYGRIQHPSEMFEVSQSIEVIVLKFDEENMRVSLGYKQIRPDPWEEADYKYPVGAIVRGKVVSIPDYGAFIELEDGIEGLVHISEMTWNKRVKQPTKLVEIGDTIEAKVLGVDMENKRISLGMRQLEANPWDKLEEAYPVGSIVNGQVRNITDFGIFIGIDEGIDGLVHISDLSWGQRIKHPGERFEKGDDVEARVLNIDRDNERISLGIKQLTDDPWLSVQGRYFLGQVVEGAVVHMAEFGLFVELEEGVEGLVHISELTEGGDDWAAHYEMGAKLSTVVLSIDAVDRKISLSQQAAEDRDGSDEAGTYTPPAPAETSARLGDLMGDIASQMSGIEAAAPAEEAAEEAEAAPAEEAAEEAEAAPAEEAEAAPAEEAAEEAEAAPAEEAAEEAEAADSDEQPASV